MWILIFEIIEHYNLFIHIIKDINRLNRWIVFYIKNLQSFSDIQDLSNSINAGGHWHSLEDFLNDQLFDDPEEMRIIAQHLKRLAVRSNKQIDTIRLVNGKISIGLGQ